MVWLLCFSVLLVVTLVAGFGWVGFLVCGGFGVICVLGGLWVSRFWADLVLHGILVCVSGGDVGSSMVLFFWVLAGCRWFWVSCFWFGRPIWCQVW